MDYSFLQKKVNDFIASLENGKFDCQEYLDIERNLLTISSDCEKDSNVEKKIVEMFYDFVSSINSSYYFHINENDVFEVEDIDIDLFKSYCDRASLLMGILLGKFSYSSQSYYFSWSLI